MADTAELCARHYERRAARYDRLGRGTIATNYRSFAAKARAGKVNPFVLRVAGSR